MPFVYSGDDWLFVAFADPLRRFLWHYCVVSFVAYDYELTAGQFLTALCIDRHPADLLAVNEAVVILGLEPGDPVLLNDLLDLSDAGLAKKLTAWRARQTKSVAKSPK